MACEVLLATLELSEGFQVLLPNGPVIPVPHPHAAWESENISFQV